MEFVKQVWNSSGTFRVVVSVIAVGAALIIATGDGGAQPPKTDDTSSGGVVDALKRRLPGSGQSLPGRATKTADKVLDVFDKTLDRTADAIEGTLKTPEE